jgi:hypothetical protein
MNILRRFIQMAIVGLSGLASIAHAQPYGEGDYGSAQYGSETISIGPFTLPITGADILLAICIAAAIAGIVLLIWRVRKSRATSTSE